MAKEELKIEISKDKMLGVVVFQKPESNCEMLTYNEIVKAIEESGITMGIMEENLEEICSNHVEGHKYIIARGMTADNGEDGEIELKFDPEALTALKPKERTDGTVDIRDMGAAKNVEKGTVLAVRTLATSGTDGYNVLGKTLKAKKGKEAKFPKGKNTRVLEDGLTLVADIEGRIEYDGFSLSMSPTFLVNGDVDTNVGNIDFVGSVEVTGSVQSGFTIKAGGSVEVRGPVEDAVIISGGDIILSRGIQGTENSKLIAKGNVVTKFVQNAQVEAGGNVISESLIHSKVVAGDSILVESGKGNIIGGRMFATNKIVAKTIGSPLGVATSVNMGVPPSMHQEFKDLKVEMSEKEAALNKMDQGVKFLMLKKTQGTPLTAEQEVMLSKLMMTRKSMAEEYEECKHRYQEIEKHFENINAGLIECTDKLYPGVKVVFGEISKNIKTEWAKPVIRKVKGDIKIGV